MGSRKSPDIELPFGYTFDAAANSFPFESPPAPAPGPSLLDADESKFLANFFDGVSSETYNSDFFAVDGGQINFGWAADLPPAFMGTSSSYGQESHATPTSVNELAYADLQSPMAMPGSQLPTTTPDVLAAAPLLQSLHNRPPPARTNSIAPEMLLSAQDVSHTVVPRHSASRPQTMNSFASHRPRPHHRPSMPEPIRDTFYTEMFFGSPATQIPPREKLQNPTLDWGSDTGFGHGSNFLAPEETVESVERKLRHRLDFLEPNGAQAIHPQSTQTMSKTAELARVPMDLAHVGNGEMSTARLSFNEPDEVDEEEEEDVNDAFRAQPRKRRGPKVSPATVAATPPLSKRRKSGNAPKPPRENLSEEQKRENHIRSEQKRRTLIKEGFDDLGELVPDIKSGGFSKSAILTMAADWLQDLLQGNDELRARLKELKLAKGILDD